MQETLKNCINLVQKFVTKTVNLSVSYDNKTKDSEGPK